MLLALYFIALYLNGLQLTLMQNSETDVDFMDTDVCVYTALISDLFSEWSNLISASVNLHFTMAIKYHPLSNCFRSFHA